MPPAAASAIEISTLSILFEFDDNPDRPVVAIEVDGRNPFEQVADGWTGFDPADMFGPERPLQPRDPTRRIAIYRCSCGEPGCGVIAPLVVRSSDGRRVSWTDFRRYTGVFNGPVADDAARYKGDSWGLPAIHFDAAQYTDEVRRAAADRSWETPRRLTARLVEEQLRAVGFTLLPDLGLDWVSPAWQADGVELGFWPANRAPSRGQRRVLLHIPTRHADPRDAARYVIDRLLHAPSGELIREFDRMGDS